MTICEKKHVKLPRVMFPFRDKMFRYILSPKCNGGQTVWPYYDLDSTGTASCALPVQCALVCTGVVAPGWGQAMPLLLTSDNTSGGVTTIII